MFLHISIMHVLVNFVSKYEKNFNVMLFMYLMLFMYYMYTLCITCIHYVLHVYIIINKCFINDM